uniref:Uncharacterized protein n=1 Tax=Ditylenchus dipsaci TaxID=166011 RepID=A0A915CU04_9BILA
MALLSSSNKIRSYSRLKSPSESMVEVNPPYSLAAGDRIEHKSCRGLFYTEGLLYIIFGVDQALFVVFKVYAMSDSPATKRSKRAKETFNPEYDEVVAWNSKQYGGWFDILLNNGELTNKVVCKEAECRGTLNKKAGESLRQIRAVSRKKKSCSLFSYHIGLHNKKEPASQEGTNDALLKFIITSGQSVNLMGIRALSNFSILLGNFRLKLTRLAQRRPPRICYLKVYNEQVDR